MNPQSQKYKKIQQIGQGSSGKIFKVQHKQTGQILAAKIISINANQNQLQSIQQQAKIMTMCSHPNIIKCHGIELFHNEVWLILEYCQGGSLADIMRKQKATFGEQQIAVIAGQVLQGLAHLHCKGIVHRDVKAANLLFCNGVVKIADFGVALLSETGKGASSPSKESKLDRIGSPFWMSPESLSQSIYCNKCDIWALGITAIQLAQGQPPYSHQHPFRAIYSIQTHPPENLSKPEEWSKDFCSFVKKCLTLEYKNRPSAENMLSHVFVQKISAELTSRENSPQHTSFEEENTIIQHEQLPKSLWQKNSYPQTSQKQNDSPEQCNNTVVINQNLPSDISLFSNLKKTLEEQQQSDIKMKVQDSSNKENINANCVEGAEERERKVKELYRAMEQQVKQTRQNYMARIRELYQPSQSNWSSPLRKLKAKKSDLLRKQHSRFSSELIRHMF